MRRRMYPPRAKSGCCRCQCRWGVATITAWNFSPTRRRGRSVALAAGCTVVGRPSATTWMSAMALVNLLEEVWPAPWRAQPGQRGGEPRARPCCARLGDKPELHRFAGRRQTATRSAADGIKRLSLELGGSAPCAGFPDVNVETVAKVAVAAKFLTTARSASRPAGSTFIMLSPRSLSRPACSLIGGLVVGPGSEPQVTTGPLVTAAARERMAGFVADAVGKGAEVVTGGAPPAHLGAWLFLCADAAPQICRRGCVPCKRRRSGRSCCSTSLTSWTRCCARPTRRPTAWPPTYSPTT